jgi:hypothetical protein
VDGIDVPLGYFLLRTLYCIKSTHRFLFLISCHVAQNFVHLIKFYMIVEDDNKKYTFKYLDEFLMHI